MDILVSLKSPQGGFLEIPDLKSLVPQSSIVKCGFQQLNHPPYCIDRTPSDYYLYRNLKSNLRGRSFIDDQTLKHAEEEWFEDRSEDIHRTGVQSLRDK